jgi:hypothetical protein
MVEKEQKEVFLPLVLMGDIAMGKKVCKWGRKNDKLSAGRQKQWPVLLHSIS